MKDNYEEKLYSVGSSKSTGEHHIFRASLEKNACVTRGDSICKHINADDAKVEHHCITVEKVREAMAQYGDDFCGNCAQRIFKTVD